MDIISVKKIAFLLGKFIPLGLGLLRYLRDCSEAKVGTAVPLMLAKATSRSVDSVQLRCEGGGAIGALNSSVQASGIVASVAGPSQHVVVVERMTRLWKGH